MTTETTKYTNASAAGDEVHAPAEQHMSAKGGTYAEAAHAVLASDPSWRELTRNRPREGSPWQQNPQKNARSPRSL